MQLLRSPRLRRLAVLFGLSGGVFFLGPRHQMDIHMATPRPVPTELSQLEAWLASSEASVTDLRPGTAKGIVWAGPEKRRTPWAVVYIHGFTASRLETAPTADKVAAALGANLFYTRLAGHGQSTEAMAAATPQDWMADTLEAVAIAQQLGERILVIGCSTGATLATGLALRPEGKAVAAYSFISPNFGPKDKRADIVTWPWGKQIAHLIQGPLRSSPVTDPREAIAWTNPYPTAAIVPMMSLVKQIRESDLTRFDKPVLMLYSEADQTVEPEFIKEAFARIGATTKGLEAVNYSKARGQHVLAGDIMAPDATQPLADAIVRWVRNIST